MARSAAGQPDAWLCFIDESGRERDQMPLRIGKTIIGRSEGEVLLRKDPFVSPWHAQLTVRRNGVTIKDMFSRNGIYKKVERQTVLRDLDRVLVGRQVLRFREGWTEGRPDDQGTRALGGPRPRTNARLLVLTDSDEVADQRVVRETLTIGRSGCDLSIPEDDLLEDRHAQIQWDGSGYIIIDLASRDGIYVAIREETELQDSDVIQIGMQRLRVRRSL